MMWVATHLPSKADTGNHLMGSLAWDGCSLCSPHHEFCKVVLMIRSELFLHSSSELSVQMPTVGSPLPQALSWLAPSAVGRLGQLLSCWDPRPHCRGGWCIVLAGSIGGSVSGAPWKPGSPAGGLDAQTAAVKTWLKILSSNNKCGACLVYDISGHATLWFQGFVYGLILLHITSKDSNCFCSPVNLIQW